MVNIVTKKSITTANLTTRLEEVGFRKPYYTFLESKKRMETVGDVLSFAPRLLEYKREIDAQNHIGEKVALALVAYNIHLPANAKHMFIDARDDSNNTYRILSYERAKWGAILSKRTDIRLAVYGALKKNTLRSNSGDIPEYFISANRLEFYNRRVETVYYSKNSDNQKMKRIVAHLMEIVRFDDRFSRVVGGGMTTKNMLNFLHSPNNATEYHNGVHRYLLGALVYYKLLKVRAANFLIDKHWKMPPCEDLKYHANNQLGFDLNNSQKSTIKELIGKIKSARPTLSYVIGDVGAGKSVVAYEIMYSLYIGLQRAILLAPTRVLAKQHYDKFIEYYGDVVDANDVAILTSGDKLSRDISDYKIIFGTHALFKYKDTLGTRVLIIDEPQEFGVEQQKWGTPTHYVMLTATPLPKWTLLLMSGLIDYYQIENRKRNVLIVPINYSLRLLTHLLKKLPPEEKKMIVVPRISSDMMEYPNLEGVASILDKLQIEYKVAHGRLQQDDVIDAITEFRDGNSNVLLATQMVKSGIDIKNLKYLIVIAAERFGLPNLYQLIGRVGRDGRESFAYLLSNVKDFLDDIKSREKVTQIDLMRRGAGRMGDKEQSGFVHIRLGDYINQGIVNQANVVANKILGMPERDREQIIEELSHLYGAFI